MLLLLCSRWMLQERHKVEIHCFELLPTIHFRFISSSGHKICSHATHRTLIQFPREFIVIHVEDKLVILGRGTVALPYIKPSFAAPS
jgi:hypothetical protein